MVIKADEQGQDMIKQLCDLALKASGLNALDGVVMTLRSTQLIKEPEQTETKPE